MPARTVDSCSGEELIARVRRLHLIGRFKIHLSQTEIHADQRPFDEAWVEELSKKIGDKDNLNRALHPIGAILKSDEELDRLRRHVSRGDGTVQDLPDGVQVLVFAGQHRLAVLTRLGFDDTKDRWWHGDVYAHGLEKEHPAEFLTMMHESNTPQVMKATNDVDLFRAVIKLRVLLEAGTIDRQSFLLNRQALLAHNEVIARAICTLTRNQELADAITEALSRPHIVKTFQAGPWKRLATGRLWGVAAGLVREMICQVDLLTKGLVDVPLEPLVLKPRACHIANLEAVLDKKRKQAHPWDVLPGKLAGALKRARARPLSFVTPLNPKTADSWSLPEVILLPSCLGAAVVENELKLLHDVIVHLLRMCAKEEHFQQYISASSETFEISTDHPAGMIAHVLMEQRGDRASGYEQKILHHAWRFRKELHEGIMQLEIPEAVDATDKDYTRLLSQSRCWWDLLRLFKCRNLPFGLGLSISKHFGTEEVEADSQITGGELLPSGSVEPHQDLAQEALQQLPPAEQHTLKRPHEHDPAAPAHPKRTRLRDSSTGAAVARQEARQDLSVVDLEEGRNRTETRKQRVGLGESTSRTDNHAEKSDEEESFDGSDNEGIGADEALPTRTGGDRHLSRVLARLHGATNSMTRLESQGLATLLTQVMDSRRYSSSEPMISALTKKAGLWLSKLERMEQAQYDSSSEQAAAVAVEADSAGGSSGDSDLLPVDDI